MQPLCFLLRDIPLLPKTSKSHNFFISQPNHFPQSPFFIILNSLSSQPIKILRKLLQWQNHQRSERGLQPLPWPPKLDAMEPLEHSQHQFLLLYHLLRCSPWKNNVSSKIIFSLLVPL